MGRISSDSSRNISTASWFRERLGESKYLSGKIREHHTTILIMGVGAPKSEVWVWRHQHQLPNCWALCLGQAVRIALGLTTRAPRLIRTLHGEWLWRICQEPRRLAGRYIRGSVMFLVAIFEDLAGSKSLKNNTEKLIHLYGQIYDAMPSSFVSQLKMVELDNDICVTIKNGQQFWFTSDTSVRAIVKRIVRNISAPACLFRNPHGVPRLAVLARLQEPV